MVWGHEQLFHEIVTNFFCCNFMKIFICIAQQFIHATDRGKNHSFLLSFFFSSMMSNVQVISAIALLLNDEDEEKENVQERSQWVQPWIARRKHDGAFYAIFQELKQEDAEGFGGYVKLNTTSFEKLVELLVPSLLKKDTVMQECINQKKCVAQLSVFCEQ